jgi:AraC family transcriptional regulator, regulatory protein of adaptative response / methylphosphotriester-DNA alkyltransferase methyltransferase
MQRPATIRHRTALFEDAVGIVRDEYASDLSLDDIARRVASSRRQLQRAYAEIGDTTFREHLTGVRMDRAAEMLQTRGLTVREVARRVGYRQPAQFAKAFRRRHGLAPSDFRAARRHPPARADASRAAARAPSQRKSSTRAEKSPRKAPAGPGRVAWCPSAGLGSRSWERNDARRWAGGRSCRWWSSGWWPRPSASRSG